MSLDGGKVSLYVLVACLFVVTFLNQQTFFYKFQLIRILLPRGDAQRRNVITLKKSLQKIICWDKGEFFCPA